MVSNVPPGATVLCMTLGILSWSPKRDLYGPFNFGVTQLTYIETEPASVPVKPVYFGCIFLVTYTPRLSAEVALVIVGSRLPI